MIRKLRTKLVAAAMLSLLAVLTVILGVILLTNYRGIVSDADRILDLLADNQGKFPEIKADFDWEELGPRHRSVELAMRPDIFPCSWTGREQFWPRTPERSPRWMRRPQPAMPRPSGPRTVHGDFGRTTGIWRRGRGRTRG